MAEQGEIETLFPAEPPRGAAQTLKVADLPLDPHTRAKHTFVKSVKRFGVMEPIIVADKSQDEPSYQIIDGRRRLAAARAAGLDTIPARVFDAEDIEAYSSMLTVALNEQRSSNPVSSFAAVYDLAVNKRVPEAIIARSTGLTVPTVKALLGLTSLHPEIKDRMLQGKIKFSVARMIAKTSRESQGKIVMQLVAQGDDATITAREVRELCPEFQVPPPAEQFMEAWVMDVASSVSRLIACAPKNPAAVAILASLTQVAATVESLGALVT